GSTSSASGTFGARRTRGSWREGGCCLRARNNGRIGSQVRLELVAQVSRDVNRFLNAAGVLLGVERDVDDVAILRFVVGLELEGVFVVALHRDNFERLLAADDDLLRNLLSLSHFAQEQRFW